MISRVMRRHRDEKRSSVRSATRGERSWGATQQLVQFLGCAAQSAQRDVADAERAVSELHEESAGIGGDADTAPGGDVEEAGDETVDVGVRVPEGAFCECLAE